ncbi:S-methyl-5-thioribose kinase [Enemella sp. A6]|uniref:S-methyl-5-thioribose kinase n=1 Tax=Enemella sp. A6 TaxID=3440152 RepID=UPI003EB89DB4
MSDYEFLTVDTVAEYLRTRPGLSEHIDPENLVDVREVGDGNLNLVFLAKDDTGRGICLKQSLPYVRMTGEGWPMTPERARREANALRTHAALTPDLVPTLYDFNHDRYVMAMEDLSDHNVWRGLLNESESHEGVAEAMGRYVGSLAFGTSVFALPREELSEQIAATQNPQLCEITEDLVCTEPVHDIGRNSVLAANQPDADAFAADPAVRGALGWAKWIFMTQAEALIHGDLHTGSVMVRRGEDGRVDSIKAFDPEFAFYGPVGYDVGALWANYVIAAARALALGEDDRAHWCLSLIGRTWDSFTAEFIRLWPSRRDDRIWDDTFRDERIEQWRRDAWLFAGAKMSRRIVGAAKTTDVETLAEPVREGAARGVLRTATAMFNEVWQHRRAPECPALLDLATRELVDSRTNTPGSTA